MKKLFRTIATWLKSMFAKKQSIKTSNEVKNGSDLERSYSTCTTPVVSIRTCEYPFQNSTQNPESCSSNYFEYQAKEDTFIKDQKQKLKEWAKRNNEKLEKEEEHKMILSQTVRDSKPNKYSTNKHIVHVGGDKKFKLTAKQDFFLTEIRILQEKNQDANINDVIVAFLDLKYANSQMTPTQDELKPSYHKKTINYLVKCGAIKSPAKNCYRTNF